jgi:hypothetical protein
LRSVAADAALLLLFARKSLSDTAEPALECLRWNGSEDVSRSFRSGRFREKSSKMKKRMDDVEQTAPRKRGGQPGNRNAVKTGRHTAARKQARREMRATRTSIRTFRQKVVAVCRLVRKEIRRRAS